MEAQESKFGGTDPGKASVRVFEKMSNAGDRFVFFVFYVLDDDTMIRDE